MLIVRNTKSRDGFPLIKKTANKRGAARKHERGKAWSHVSSGCSAGAAAVGLKGIAVGSMCKNVYTHVHECVRRHGCVEFPSRPGSPNEDVYRGLRKALTAFLAGHTAQCCLLVAPAPSQTTCAECRRGEETEVVRGMMVSF